MWLRPRRSEPSPEGVFTEYVRSLSQGEPAPALFAALCGELSAALRTELRRRGLWNAPPSYLGILGGGSWDGDALDELRADAHTFVFVDRLRSLRAQLEANKKANVDGLVRLAVRNFVQERQEKHDPLGTQVYAVLRSAVEEAVEAGELHLLRGGDRIGNDTVLGFERGEAGSDPEPPAMDLRALAARWNGRLMPGLVTDRGRHQAEVVRRLRGLLPELRAEGAEVFRFKDLIDPMKADVRARWASAFEHEVGETGLEEGEGGEIRKVRMTPPDLGVEDRQFLRKVIACVLESVARLDVSETTRGYLYRLWQFRRVQAEEGADREPSARKLGDLLNVPRERIPDLGRKLDELLESCRAANSGKLAVTRLQGVLSLAIHEGELVLFPETAGHPVEWAVLGWDAEHPGQVLVVPADTNTKAGTADVEATGSVAPLTLRCPFGVWISEARAAAAPRSEGALSPEDVSAAKRIWEAKERGEPVGSLLAEEVNAHPDYRDWIEDVLIPARACISSLDARLGCVALLWPFY